MNGKLVDLDNILIAPEVVQGWQDMVNRVLPLLEGGISQDEIGEEKARLLPDNTLIVFVEIKGEEAISLAVPPPCWRWRD
jgi:hypothetical protein